AVGFEFRGACPSGFNSANQLRGHTTTRKMRRFHLSCPRLTLARYVVSGRGSFGAAPAKVLSARSIQLFKNCPFELEACLLASFTRLVGRRRESLQENF